MLNLNDVEAAVEAANNPLLLETTESLQAAAAAWSKADVLGLDTEFLRERTYRAELGLVQVSDGRQAWLVDVLKIKDLGPLRKMFEDPGTLKVFHSASEDFEALWHALGVSPQPVVDTQVACAMIGQPLQMSYHNAIKWLTGIEVDKDQTRSNWLRRPLTARQLHYAATDVVFLPSLWAQVNEKLEQEGKWQWLEEDVNRLVAQGREGLDPALAYFRLGAAASLNGKHLKVLRSLAAWRERQAIERNLARGFVITDTELVLLARHFPGNLDELHALEGLHQHTLSRHGAELLEAIRLGQDSSEPAAPLVSLDTGQKKQVSELRKLVQHEATVLGIDPALLASRKVLETLLLAVETDSEIPERLSGWRYPVITGKLINFLRGEN
jgi:ribonuclease D